MGVPEALGPRRSTLALVESRVAPSGPDEVFAGVDAALVKMARRLGSEEQEKVEPILVSRRFVTRRS